MAADRYSSAPTQRPATVAAYIAAAPKASRPKLRALRACIRAAAPGAVENLKWGMPAYSNRRILVIFGAFKNHIGLFSTGSAQKAFAQDLAGYKTGRGSIQFPHVQPLPLPLIRRIVKLRVKESLTKDVKWKR